MEYRKLGNTGVSVSAIALGCGSFGGIGSNPALFGQGADSDEAGRIMDRSVDLGINCFDTSNCYGGGASEEMIGHWLHAKGSAVRDQILIATKVHHRVGPGVNDYGLSRRHIMQQVDQSLRRLQVDYIDMYLVHDSDPRTSLEETLRTLDDLVRAGKVRYLGVDGFPAWMIMKSLAVSERLNLNAFQWVEESFSLIDRRLEKEVLPLCVDQGLSVMPFSPLGAGILSGKYRPGEQAPDGSRVALSSDVFANVLSDEIYRDLEVLRGVADRLGTTCAAVSLAWILRLPSGMAPILGARRLGHLDVVAEALRILPTLSSDDMAELDGLFETSQGIPRGKLGRNPETAAASVRG